MAELYTGMLQLSILYLRCGIKTQTREVWSNFMPTFNSLFEIQH